MRLFATPHVDSLSIRRNRDDHVREGPAHNSQSRSTLHRFRFRNTLTYKIHRDRQQVRARSCDCNRIAFPFLTGFHTCAIVSSSPDRTSGAKIQWQDCRAHTICVNYHKNGSWTRYHLIASRYWLFLFIQRDLLLALLPLPLPLPLAVSLALACVSIRQQVPYPDQDTSLKVSHGTRHALHGGLMLQSQLVSRNLTKHMMVMQQTLNPEPDQTYDGHATYW